MRIQFTGHTFFRKTTTVKIILYFFYFTKTIIFKKKFKIKKTILAWSYET